MAPSQIMKWIKQAYPKPVVNSEWLDACCAWISDERHLNAATQTEAFVAEVENQLLESDLRDSMEPGTGLPPNARTMNNQRIKGSPHILVEVTAVTEIGHSAFTLHNVRQARIERADLAGLAQEEGAEDDEGPIPNYPRIMLRLEISDGSVIIPAIEYRSIPSLKLDETPLGFKILLKDVLVRRGIAFLEPKGIVLKGHRNSDRDEFRERNFVHGLLRRMMKPIPQVEGNEPDENMPPPQGPHTSAQPAVEQSRAPLREISEPPVSTEDAMDMDEEADLPRKRRIPNPSADSLPPPSASARTSSSTSSSRTLVASQFFGGSSSAASTATAIEATTQRLARVLSPVRGDPIDITDSSMEGPEPSGSRSMLQQATSSRQTQNQSGTLSRDNGNATRTRISYEEFEFDDDDEELDAAFLEEIAKVEKEALSRESGQSVSRGVSHSREGATPSGSAGRLREEADRRSNTPVAHPFPSSSSVTPASSAQRRSPSSQIIRSRGPLPPPSSSTSAPLALARTAPITTQSKTTTTLVLTAQASDVITIDDDEDDDKENVPVPKRRVRRRISTFPPPPRPDDVIDISD